MSKLQDDLSLSKNALEMVLVANEFCLFLESAEGQSKTSIMEFAHRVLPLMYTKGSLLPSIEVEYPEANVKFVTQEQWEDLFQILREKFQEQDEFWVIDPQYINETEPLKASLAENLSDIYQDMKDFVMLFQKNTMAARENAIADCKTLFAEHWGYRITNSLARLHSLLYDGEKDDILGDMLPLF